MSTKRLLLLFALMTLWINNSSGQASLGISFFSWNGPQSVNYGDTATYTYSVKNYGTTTINTPVTIYTGVWDSSMNAIDTIAADNFSLAQITLGPGDSAWVNDTIVYDSINFRIGATVVVIWPAASNATTHNNASFTVYVGEEMSAIEIVQPGRANVYPNPTTGKLTISPPAGENGLYVGQVRLFDDMGRLLMERKGAGTLDVEALPAGIYLIEILQDNNTRTVYRVIKQEH